MNRRSAFNTARAICIGVLAALNTGCATDLVASGVVTVEHADSTQIDLSPPGVQKDGDFVVVSGTVTRTPDFDGTAPGYLQILFLAKDGSLLDELWPPLDPSDIPTTGARQSTYQVRYQWIPPSGTVVRAVFGRGDADLPSGSASGGGGSSNSPAHGSSGHQHHGGSGSSHGGGHR